MNTSITAENARGKAIANEEQHGIRTAELLFNAVPLQAAIVACAIAGPKLPPYEGD
jgi:hypothetical protein